MVKAAVKDYFDEDFPVKVDPIEVEHGNSIPTYYLLQNYKKAHPETEFWFVIGTDLISGLHYWDESERLINDINFVIFEREGFEVKTLINHSNWPKNYKLAYKGDEKNLLGGISSTEVRKRVKKQQGI